MPLRLSPPSTNPPRRSPGLARSRSPVPLGTREPLCGSWVGGCEPCRRRRGGVPVLQHGARRLDLELCRRSGRPGRRLTPGGCCHWGSRVPVAGPGPGRVRPGSPARRPGENQQRPGCPDRTSRSAHGRRDHPGDHNDRSNSSWDRLRRHRPLSADCRIPDRRVPDRLRWPGRPRAGCVLPPRQRRPTRRRCRTLSVLVPGQSHLGADVRPAPHAGQVAVNRGDTLWSIAAHRLGPKATSAEIDAEWHRWFAANRKVIGADADAIEPGQLLSPPAPLQVSS